MSDVSALSVGLLRRISEFLDGLPEEHITDLAEGRAHLTFVPWGASAPVRTKVTPATRKQSAPKVDTATMVETLKRASSRDEGRDLLKPLSATELRAVATAAGMTGVSKTRKEDLVEQVVGLTVGGRISFAALRDL